MNLIMGLVWGLYFFIGFCTLCVGVFGVAATKTERFTRAIEVSKTRPWYNSTDLETRYYNTYQKLTKNEIAWSVLCGLYWPAGIPLYLAWKKGTFVNDALNKRQEMMDNLKTL